MLWLIPPPLRAKHTEERLKLAANGLQAIALALLVSAFLAPAFNTTLSVPIQWKVLAGVAIAHIEFAALALLRYIPLPEEAAP